MSDAGEPYLLDVGVLALAHSTAPVRDSALTIIRDAITGDIDAVVPYPALFGAHHVLTAYFGCSNSAASRRLQNLMDAKRIHWYDRMPEGIVRSGLSQAGETNVDGWDGYYAQVAIDEGINTVLTIDDDFERFDSFDTEIILSPDEFAELNRFLER